jgi:ubiquitin-like protein Pup
VPQEQEQKRIKKREEGGGDAPGAESPEASAKGQELKEEMDDILDEIDSVLEQNAEEFVKSYVQKGGE